ncbi:MAG: hypothetical protein QM775_23555 [Pirellulales bacterium]
MSRAVVAPRFLALILLLFVAVVVSELPRRTSEAEEATKPAAANSLSAQFAALQPAGALPELPAGRTFPLHERSELELRIEAALSEPAEIDYSDAELGVVTDDLTKRYRIPFVLDRPALTADGKGSESKITWRLKGASLRNVLRHVLEEQGLTFIIKNDALMITTKTAAETHTPIRFYQVHDLAFYPTAKSPAKPDLDPLLDLITLTIDPETWRESGGTQGELKPFIGPGVVGIVATQTHEVHEQIEALLAMLRAAHDPKLLELQRRSPPERHAESPKPVSAAGSSTSPDAGRGVSAKGYF